MSLAEKQNVNLDPLKALVARVIRTFYDSREAIITDRLLSNTSITPIVTDSELAKYCRLTPKDINRLCARLVKDRLLRMEARGEAKKIDGKIIPKNYYVLDYKLFADVTRWKVNKIDKRIRDNLAENMDNRGYVCTHCEKRFTMLDAVALLNPMTNMFECDIDQTNLEEDRNPESVRISEQTLQRLSEQIKNIVDLLRQCDTVTLPVYNARLLEQELKAGKKTAAQAGSGADGDVALSADSGKNNDDIVVEFFSHDDEHARQQKQAERDKKREQNALPVWHRVSTVSGDAITASLEDHTLPASAGVATVEPATGSAMDTDADNYYKEYLSNISFSEAQGSPASSMQTADDDDEDEELEFEDVTAPAAMAGTKRALNGNDDYSEKRVRISGDDDDDDDDDEEMTFEEVVPANGGRNTNVEDDEEDEFFEEVPAP
ncbi:hypothetical protein RI367_002112 [Sorochytrium milnesiophthora]